MALSRDALRVRRTVEQLLRDQPDDLRLRDHLEGLRDDPAFPGLTWFWGPELYRRNRVVFRELIMNRFSDLDGPGWPVSRVSWSTHADRLEAWLAAARGNRDSWLTRRLLMWKFAGAMWGIDDKRWTAALVADYRAAPGPAAQAVVLEEYSGWFQLDEASAIQLYQTNPVCTKFLLEHLPVKFSFWGREARQPWRTLIQLAREGQHDELACALYRRQIDAKEWQRDIEQLAREVADPDQLNEELRRRHLEGWGLNLADGALSLLKLRGRDVMPYVREHLSSLLGGWYARNTEEPFLKFAAAQGWWDLWTAVVRTASDPRIFNREIGNLLNDSRLDFPACKERLKALAGVSQEWNWPGFGLARVHALDDDVAVKLYGWFPDLVRGPYKPHIVPTWWQGGPKLLAAAMKDGDDDLVDVLASRYLTRAGHDWAGGRKAQDIILQAAQKLADLYQQLRDQDEATFARRAGNVLTQVPAFAIYAYDQLLRTNDLARLLFVRSFSAFLASPGAVRDLIEGSEIHVQMLGYRVLAQEDDRARQLAVETFDILQGTLLRPLHRKTRLAAFGALRNAARHDEVTAQRVLQRAREALRLPDRKYPKEELVGLMASILQLWPTLRSPRERPVVYGLAEV